MQVISWRGPNKENFEKKFYRQCKLAGPQHREIGTPISTGNASWRGPNKEKLEHQFQQAMQVGGAPT
ncbi:nitrogen fixation protein NifR [Staphylococcus aureus]|nr:nitrogen fixation protein NifR [Staphylococcus aureus]MDR8573791.1 nitrogen fixation protein NifR [Staphylococcus aureus]MDR8587344.1 nitrogen fixation protein NifR [Staphylococcus aureus]MDR8630579.1 nitrogen fixation protein NifR [Staphylococcus aureus]MDR8632286.1 nitrogen fixation protein NifR [Staphylococcus aureus]